LLFCKKNAIFILQEKFGSALFLKLKNGKDAKEYV